MQTLIFCLKCWQHIDSCVFAQMTSFLQFFQNINNIQIFCQETVELVYRHWAIVSATKCTQLLCTDIIMQYLILL